MAAGAMDEKDDESNCLAVFFSAQETASGELKLLPVGGARAEIMENADHDDVVRSAAGVLAAGDL